MLLRALHFSNPLINHHRYTSSPATSTAHSRLFPYDLRLPIQRFSSITIQSHYNSTTTAVAESESESPESSTSSEYIETVGLPSGSVLQLSQWNLTHRHVLVLNVIACAVIYSLLYLISFLYNLKTLLLIVNNIFIFIIFYFAGSGFSNLAIFVCNPNSSCMPFPFFYILVIFFSLLHLA